MTSSPIATCVKRNVWFPGKRCQRAKNVDMLSAGIRSTSETSRRWYCRCQGIHGLGCPQQLWRQRLIIQQIEIRHINQHQSRLGIFVHSEVENQACFPIKIRLFAMSLIRPNLALRIDREQERVHHQAAPMTQQCLTSDGCRNVQQ